MQFEQIGKSYINALNEDSQEGKTKKENDILSLYWLLWQTLEIVWKMYLLQTLTKTYVLKWAYVTIGHRENQALSFS